MAKTISSQMNKGQIKCMVGGKIVGEFSPAKPLGKHGQNFHVALFGFRQVPLNNNIITQAR